MTDNKCVICQNDGRYIVDEHSTICSECYNIMLEDFNSDIACNTEFSFDYYYNITELDA